MLWPVTSKGVPRVLLRSAAVCLIGCFAQVALRAGEPDPGGAPEEAIEVLARGPVHEAFAAVTGRDAEPGVIVTQQPPDPVDELPPEVQPEGDNVQWIPGYWSWDEEQETFIWVSGVWRNVPPGRRWIPGHWEQVEDGFAWISGFWSDADRDIPPPLPAPPDRPDEARGDPPDDNHFWIPGCWVFRNDAYVWRAGYWTRFWPHWVWVPSYYLWTPAGCLYVNGYWDYSLAYRGFLYAPVRFRHTVHFGRPFHFRPRHCIDVARIHLHLFVHPRHPHYLFGDYHDPRFARRGYFSHTKHHLSGRGHDCLFSYYQTLYRRRGFDYARRVQGWHHYYAKHHEHRPPHTRQAQEEIVRKQARHPHPRQSLLVQPIDDIRRRVPLASSASNRLRQVTRDRPDISDRVRDALRHPASDTERARDVARRRAPSSRPRLENTSPIRDETHRSFSRVRAPDASSSDNVLSRRRDLRVPAGRRASPDASNQASSAPSLARQRASEAFRRGSATLQQRQTEQLRQLRSRVIPRRDGAADHRRMMEHAERLRSHPRAAASRAPDVSALRQRAARAAPFVHRGSSATRNHVSVPRMRPSVSQGIRSQLPSAAHRGPGIRSQGRGGPGGGGFGRARGRSGGR